MKFDCETFPARSLYPMAGLMRCNMIGGIERLPHVDLVEIRHKLLWTFVGVAFRFLGQLNRPSAQVPRSGSKAGSR